mmetsp:Transcript_51230/g.161140  ORF Transcript_51230/g.161140 Transcript_51230/m.161140 type:complete len:114 (-) Transcript_51230:32-373(-)
MPSPHLSRVSGAAPASATPRSQGAALAAPPPIQAPGAAGEAPSPAERLELQQRLGATAGLATAACALAVAGGAAGLHRRRSATAAGVLRKPIPVVDWQVPWRCVNRPDGPRAR